VVAVPGLGEPRIVERAANLGWCRVGGILAAGEVARKVRGPPLSVENEANLGALADLWQDNRATNLVMSLRRPESARALVVDGRLRTTLAALSEEHGQMQADQVVFLVRTERAPRTQANAERRMETQTTHALRRRAWAWPTQTGHR
jgi:hypothetical protein